MAPLHCLCRPKSPRSRCAGHRPDETRGPRALRLAAVPVLAAIALGCTAAERRVAGEGSVVGVVGSTEVVGVAGAGGAGGAADAAGVVDAAGAASVFGAAPVAASALGSPDPATVRLLDGDHPLAGRLWSVREHRYVGAGEIVAAFREARWLLLGERHGNPEHHRLQGRLIAKAASVGPIAVVAEQLDFPQQPAIDACARECTDFGRELGARVGWERGGWPDYAIYAPVFAAAGAASAPVLAGNPGVRRIRALAGGAPAEADEAAWTTRADAPLAEPGATRLVERLVDGHCGFLAAERTGPLVYAQRLRDAAMTAALERAAAEGRRGVLVAGSGHVRRDFGVPTLLGDAPAVVVAFVEVHAGERDPARYAPADAYDFLWFTARVDEPDPCEQFREQLRKLGRLSTASTASTAPTAPSAPP